MATLVRMGDALINMDAVTTIDTSTYAQEGYVTVGFRDGSKCFLARESAKAAADFVASQSDRMPDDNDV